MDTKRHKDEASTQAAALKAKAFIEYWQPDVVITADDNAAKYLIQPFYRDHELPFVFCGINWSLDAYGLPYKNTTGMVEVAPIENLLKKGMAVEAGAKRVLYVGADTLTEEKNLSRFQQTAKKLNLQLEGRLVSSMADWLVAYREGQQYDLVAIGSSAGIHDWDEQQARDFVTGNTQKLSLTVHGWMMPYTLLGLTKVPEEHGEWAGQLALAILNGTRPRDLPVVSNRKADIWINHRILKQTDIQLPKAVIRKAKEVH
jgi:ABC-type uncharacterized transport system substrate-binding protein